MANSTAVRVAWITGATSLVGIVLAWALGWLSPNTKPTVLAQTGNIAVNTGSGQQGAVISGAHVQNVTITTNYLVPETETRKLIKVLEDKVNDTNSSLELTRNELRLIAQALKDLDQRTSGIEKLPDGRTRLGTLITGAPTIVLSEHKAAVDEWGHGKLEAAFQHSQNAIKAYEDSKVGTAGVESGKLSHEDAAKLYYVGAAVAQLQKKIELANTFAEKAAKLNPSVLDKALYSTTLFNVGRPNEAREIVRELLATNPNDPMLKEVAKQVGLLTIDSVGVAP
jgi:tetratricopeptide (TPR) repeat protein